MGMARFNTLVLKADKNASMGRECYKKKKKSKGKCVETMSQEVVKEK